MAFIPDGQVLDTAIRRGKKRMSQTEPYLVQSANRISLAVREGLPRKTPVSRPNQGFHVPTRPNPTETSREQLRFLLLLILFRPAISSCQYSQPGPSVDADDATAERRVPPPSTLA
jgi:hypothetical protein